MEKKEEKIIDLVDIISGPDPGWTKESDPASDVSPLKTYPAEIETADLESLIRKEVERLILTTINENIQKMIREVLVQEVEKAVAREIESLKRA